MPGRVRIKITEGSLVGKERAIRVRPGVTIHDGTITVETHDVLIFGRMPDCHVRLPEQDPTVSRHHFLLECNPPDACLRDLGSLHGTYVNGIKCGGRSSNETPAVGAGRRHPEVALQDGDRITVGTTEFTVRLEMVAFCAGCGRSLAAEELAPDPSYQEGGLCPRCRSTPVGATIAVGPRCRKCGRTPLAMEAPWTAQVCDTCRKKDSAPKKMLARMLQEVGFADGLAGGPEIPGYHVCERLGAGGSGTVYLARRTNDDAVVAIKIIRPKTIVSGKARQVFEREIEVTAGLHHPNVVRLFDHGFTDEGFYLTMEYCSGGSVEELLARRKGNLSIDEAVPIVLQALEGLAFAHSQGIVHRDIKPANLLLAGRENHRAVKVGDLGLAKNFEMAGMSAMTFTGRFAGTPEFMPREQLTSFRQVKPTSDVWSAGATLYHFLTGFFPLDFPEGKDKAIVILEAKYVPVRARDASIPPAVAEVIDHALERDPRDRFPTANEMQRALAAASSIGG